jgi:hypothetical protein
MPALADLVDPLLQSPEAVPAPPEAEVAEPAGADPAVAEPEIAEPEPEVAEEAAEPEAAEAAEQVAAEAAEPEVAEAAAAVPEPGKTASEQAFADAPTVKTTDLDRGTYSPEAYRDACTAAGTPEKWDDRYYDGHTGAIQWIQPREHGYRMSFTLQRGFSASQALQDFLTGPTIADWRVIAIAHEIDDVRDTLGDHKFDALFGSMVEADDAQIPVTQRLQLSVELFTTPIADDMKRLAAQKDEALRHPEQLEEPAVAAQAQVEEKPLEAGATQQPAPELVAEELGVEQREREREHV